VLIIVVRGPPDRRFHAIMRNGIQRRPALRQVHVTDGEELEI
jgi:hypothetical protein